MTTTLKTAVRSCLSLALLLSAQIVQGACDKNIENRIEYKVNRILRDVEVIIEGNTGTCTPITQEEINLGSGVYTVLRSGLYCVNENVTGLIQVAPGVDCVSINLESHTVTAGAAGIAFSANGNEGLKIFNGCITGSTDAAILVTDYTSVELFDLNIHDYTGDGVRVDPSHDVYVHDVNFVGAGAAERALLFDAVDNFVVQRCNASGFLSTVGAVVQLDGSANGLVQNVNVTRNTKVLAAAAGGFPDVLANEAVRLVSVDTCSNVDLNQVKVNQNTSASDQDTNGLVGIGFNASTNCSLTQSEVNNNTITDGGSESIYAMVMMNNGSDNGVFADVQANNNVTGDTPVTALFGFASFGSQDLHFDRCQANDLVAQELTVEPSLGSAVIGFGAVDSSAVLYRCQGNRNSAVNPGSRIPGDQLAVVRGIGFGGATLLDSCEANGNTIGEGSRAVVTGFGCPSANLVVINCVANNNIGGELAVGIQLPTEASPELPTDVSNARLINCTAMNNGRYGIAVGQPDSTIGSGNNLEFVNCFVSQTGSLDQLSDTAGIFIAALDTPVTNVVIKGCEIDNTLSSVNGAGITVTNARNVVIEDTNVLTTTATPGYGILFDTLSDSKIIRSQVHDNTNAGVELVNTNSCIAIIESIAMRNDVGFEFSITSTIACALVQDCRALSNAASGFRYAAVPLPFTTTFIGNEAQCNGNNSQAANYDLGANLIPLQSLSWSTGVRTNVNGSDALGARFANLFMIP